MRAALRTLLCVISLSAFQLPAALAASGEDKVAVIVSASVAIHQLSAADVRELFLGRKQMQAGEFALQPVDNADKQARDLFYSGVAGMSGTRVRAYWARVVFSAQGKPPPELSPSDVSRRVMEQPGTLGYVNAANVPVGARILFTFP
ncbi:hypothetical protein [Niveibacterium sp.]|uniref:hypothetical protein n=1 Tax=Niveibacterium sp. TaxID=2017444 RepID=UPI0035B36A65